MELESYVTFLVGSLLISLGMIIIMLTLVFLNQVLYKFWKPVKIFSMEPWNLRFADPQDLVDHKKAMDSEPKVEPSLKHKK